MVPLLATCDTPPNGASIPGKQAQRVQGSTKDIQANLLPLVDRQAHHPRIRALRLGLNVDEPIIKSPLPVDSARYFPQIANFGLSLLGPARRSRISGGLKRSQDALLFPRIDNLV